MGLLTDLHPYVLPELPGCPLPILNRVIIDSAREFSRQSNIFQRIDSLDIIPGDRAYKLDLPPDMAVLRIQRVSVLNVNTPIYTEDSGIIRISDDAEGETINYYTWGPQDYINIYPIPNVRTDRKIDIRYSYQPRRDALEIPDEIIDRWAECISAKIKSVLMAQANKAWSNPQFVRINNDEWWRQLGYAKSEANRMFGNPVSAAIYSLDQ